MKLMIRNLLYLFKRFKTAVVLNLFGLTIAFAAFPPDSNAGGLRDELRCHAQ